MTACALAGAVVLSGARLAEEAVRAGAAVRQTPFRSAVDLIAVEAQVLDQDGEPITTLGQEHFQVTIDGRRRPVVSAQLVRSSGAPGVVRHLPGGGLLANELPAGDAPGRTFVVVIDVASFDPGEALPVLDAARSFIAQLPGRDRVGVMTLPAQGRRLDPTPDRAAIFRAMSAVVGRRQVIAGEFHLTESEVMDIAADGRSVLIAMARRAGGRAGGAPASLGSRTVERVQARECVDQGDLGCVEAIVSEATAIADYLDDRAAQSLAGLKVLLTALRDYPGRKTVVLLSAGIPVTDRPGGRVDIGDEARSLGAQAAHANATIYALQVDLSLRRTYAAQSRRVPQMPSLEREQRIAGQLLEQFAASAGGTRLIALADSGNAALSRVLRETAAYYLLGVDPEERLRDGREHPLQVRVNLRGATIRSRQWVVLPKANP